MPDPSAVELREADSGEFPTARANERRFTVPFVERPRADRAGARRRGATIRCDSAVVHSSGRSARRPEPFVTFPPIGRTRYGIDAIDRAMRRTPYARTWELARRLRSKPSRRTSTC